MAPFELRILKAQRQESLVLTDIGWDEMIANASRQCLITWEVSGGGLIGNLLTDTARAELSLWPDTVYNIQVKCKHKVSSHMVYNFGLRIAPIYYISFGNIFSIHRAPILVLTILTRQNSLFTIYK